MAGTQSMTSRSFTGHPSPSSGVSNGEISRVDVVGTLVVVGWMVHVPGSSGACGLELTLLLPFGCRWLLAITSPSSGVSNGEMDLAPGVDDVVVPIIVVGRMTFLSLSSRVCEVGQRSPSSVGVAVS